MSAWTSTALTRLKTLLEDDAVLSTYVDDVAIAAHLRDDAAEVEFTRHAIELAPDALTLAPHSVATNDETLTVMARLWIAAWTDDESALLTANDTSGGVGASQVGLLQFIEDVANAVRLDGLDGGTGTNLVEQTSLEGGSFSGLSSLRDPGRDRAFLFHDIPITLLRVAAHDPDDR